MWVKFELQKIATVSSPKKRFNANTLTIYSQGKEGFPYVVRTSLNNGIRGYIKEDERYLNSANTFSFGQDTATVFWQPQPYFTGDKIKILTPRREFSTEIALFILITIRKAFSMFSWGTDSFNEDIIKTTKISLPVLMQEDDTPVIDEECFFHDEGYIPDFDYMQKCIMELKQEHIIGMEKYLFELGLEESALTKADEDVLASSKIEKEFIMHDLFEKVKAPYKGNGKKQDNVSKQKTKEFDLPLINCKDGNNGIMYYGRECDFEHIEMSIDIVQNGASAVGDVYAQPQKTGVLEDAYLVKPIYEEISVQALFYLATVIEKCVKQYFSYDEKCTWDKVKEKDILLPVDLQGEPDYDYMKNYMIEIEKRAENTFLQFRKHI